MISWTKDGTERPVVQGALGISVNADSIAMAHVIADDKPKILHSSITNLSPECDAKTAMQDFINNHKLEKIPVTYILDSSDYKLSKEKDTEIEANADLTQEKFILPVLRASDSASMMYRVSAKNELIKSIANMINSTGAILHCIDIPELAICRLANLCEEISSGALLLIAGKDNILLIFYGSGKIYFTRKIAMNSPAILSQEIQRSCDYFIESFISKDLNVTKLAIFPSSYDSFELQQHLKDSLSMDIIKIDFANYFEGYIENFKDCLSISAAFRGIS